MVDFNQNISLIENDLHLGYPVVLSGTTCSTCLGNYHIWVCDGFHQDTFYTFQCSGDGSNATCVQSALLFFHLEWGEGGSFDNATGDRGWYGFTNFTQNGGVYNTNLQANIQARP